ncbi:MAG: nitrogenase, partial [Peptococcaceae bacterium]|nr:nitrogenase [Peptococcaceae bacterium]
MSNAHIELKINLDENTCYNREERLGTIKTYSGKVSELVKDHKAGNELEWKNRSFEQTSGCLLTQTVGRLVTIRDSALIVHGPVGCSQATNGYREMFQNVPLALGRPRDIDLAMLSTNLTENDVVFGGETKLRKAIYEAENRYHPGTIIIATSCVSGVMGDDIEGVVASVQPDIKARIVPIHCEGFRSKINQTAFDASAHAIVKYLVRPPEKKQKDLVNIIAPFSVTWADRMEINRLFDKIGLRTRYVPDFASAEELATMSEAAVTAPTCPSYGDYLQKALYEQYGVPYFRNPAPLGLQNTETWFREIAKYTGKEKEVEALIAEEREYVLPLLDELKDVLAKTFAERGKAADIFVAAGQARIAFIPRLVAELGLQVAAVSTLEFDPYIIDELENVYNDVGDFEIHASDMQPYEHSHMLNRLKPDLYTGCPFMGLYKREGSQVRNHSFRSDFSVPANQFVFRGILNYGYIVQRALRNPSLNKTLN